MIKAIIFDCFGVLTSEHWQEFLDGLPPGVDIDSVRKVHRSYDAQQISKEQCTKDIERLTGQTFTEIDDRVDDDISKNHRLLRYISQLKPKYKLAIASNVGSDWVRSKFLTPEEQSLFDEMFLSFEMGVIKPEPRYFQLIFQRLNTLPQEVILVDDKQRYCEAAKQQGMQAVLYENFEQMKQDLEELLAARDLPLG